MQVPKSLAVAAMVVGIAGGSYGIASAANGSSSTTTTATTTTPSQTAPPSGAPFGHQRSDETVLTGDALAKVTAAANDQVSKRVLLPQDRDSIIAAANAAAVP